MKATLAITTTIILTAIAAAAPARAAGKKTADLIKAYSANQYDSAEALGEKIVARHPDDYTAHYYLANTYVILHKNEEAMKEYRICINSGGGGALQKFSTTALERLLKQKEKALEAAKNKGGINPEEREINDFKKKIRREAQEQQVKLRKEWSEAMYRLDRNGYRPNYYRRYGGGYRSDPYMNERYRLNDYYSKKLAELSEYEESMISQANCGKGRIRIQPSLSNSKVKNYVNYGDENDVVEIPVDNPLQAVARSLNDPLPKQSKSGADAKNNRTAHQAQKPSSTPPPKQTPPASARRPASPHNQPAAAGTKPAAAGTKPAAAAAP